MQLTQFLSFALLSAMASARLHSSAVCVTDRKDTPGASSGFSVSYSDTLTYTISAAGTKCACDLYKRRNTGNKQWDQCPDCTFDGLQCNSAGWHIGGDEMTDYCSNHCGTEGAEAN